jgi:hypothetical protein
MRVALVLLGHFRTFDKTYSSWRKALEGCEYDVFCSTWDTITSNTIAWHTANPQYTQPYLTSTQIELLREFDPDVTICHQDISVDDIKNITLDHTTKSHLYRYDALCKTLNRIDSSTYDIIVVGRYDAYINNIIFKDIRIETDEIQCSGSFFGSKFVREYANTDMIYAFHPSKKNVFTNLLHIYEYAIKNNTLKYPEEVFTELFYTYFTKVRFVWGHGDHFVIKR